MRDLIDRQDAIKALNCKIIISGSGDENTEIVVNTLKSFIRKIHEIPAVDVRENVRGQWKPLWITPDGGYWKCSSCGFVGESFDEEMIYNFCPNCGADMRPRTEEDDATD